MAPRQTGGAGKKWLFSHDEVEAIPVIRDALVHYDNYFFEDPPGETTLSIVMDRLLADLPVDQAEPIKLIYLEGRSLREAGVILGVDHKTVRARANKGIAVLKKRLVDSMWVASMLRPYIPKDEITADEELRKNDISTILDTLRGADDEQE
jgi:hypothetical protein